MTELSLNNNTNQNQDYTMSSLTIAKLTNKQHKNVLRDIKKMETELGKLKNEPSFYRDEQGKNQPMYLLDESESLTLASGYNIQMRKSIIDNWLEMKKTQVNNSNLPTTFVESLEMLLQSEKEKLKLANQLQEAKPLIEYAEKVHLAVNLISIGEFAKLIGTGRNTLFSWLREHKYAMSNNVPYQNYIDSGYFQIKQKVYTDKFTGEIRVSITTYLTGKGQTYITKKYNETNKTKYLN